MVSDPTDDTAAAPVLGLGDQVDGNRAISRMYPWNDQPAFRTCYLTDATWELGDLKGNVDVDDLPMGKYEHYSRGTRGLLLTQPPTTGELDRASRDDQAVVRSGAGRGKEVASGPGSRQTVARRPGPADGPHAL
ncbi:hypothetical protein ACFU6I_42885 [Streptomyces sp. NPDC057486]|uniref:hypothetical protein n=1 Tax=Streptomyces sp. NPDC057486 TaxID=3346145 RepID=UPI0036CFF834